MEKKKKVVTQKVIKAKELHLKKNKTTNASFLLKDGS